MSEAGFLNAIRADPNDEATRLIYADYLEERGDPRGQFLRLGARLAEPGLEYTDFDELRERLKQLRAALYPKHEKWLAAVDAPDRFTVFLSQQDCDHLRDQGQVGKPLRFIAFSRFGQFKPRVGVHVYAIRVRRKKLYVVGRMRVAGSTSRDAYLPGHPDDAPLFRLWEEVVLLGDHGTLIQPDTVVSPEILHRFRYRSGDNEYPLKHVRYGEVTHSFWLGGVTPITKATSQDLDFLLTGKAARPVSAPGP